MRVQNEHRVLGLGRLLVVSPVFLALGLVACSSERGDAAGPGGMAAQSAGGATGFGGTMAVEGAVGGQATVSVGDSASVGSVTTGGGGATGSPSSGGSATSGTSAGFGGSTSSGGAGGAAAGGLGGAGGAAGSGGARVTGGGAGTGSDLSVPLDPALLDQCSGSNPVTCAISVPNGNHTVTLELGDALDASLSRAQAELFRITLPEVSLAAGALSRHTFTVNVRQEQHDGYSAPGEVLDVLIDGSMPSLNGLGVAAAPDAITVFVAGDSTVCDWDPSASNISSPDQRGWAQALSQYFASGVAVANYADSGETAGSFYGKFWPGSEPISAGDYVLIQFGHNDQKAQADIDNYKTNLMRYVDDARAKSATPILLTPVARKAASTNNPGFAGLDEQVRELASDEGVELIDLTLLSLELYQEQSDLNVFFANAGADGTHLSEVGAIAVANVVAQAIKNGPLPLSDYVR